MGTMVKKKNCQQLDLRGTLMPFNLLSVTLAAENLAAGETLEIVADNDLDHSEILTVLKRFPVAAVKMTQYEHTYRLYLVKENNNHRHNGCADTH